MNIFNKSFLVAAISAVICICQVNAQRIVNLDFEMPSTLMPHSTSGAYRAYWLLRNADPNDPARAFDFIIDTPLAAPDGTVQISTGNGVHGSRSLEIQVGPTAVLPDADRDRFEMRPIHGEGDLALEFGQVRYFGYAIYIDPANPLPVEWAHISQCWQRPTGDLDDTTVNVVPMWMTLINYQGGFGWEIRVKNEGELTDGVYPGQSSSVGTGAFVTGWNTVIMRLAPRHKHDTVAANFTVWINETREEFPTAQSSHPWGSTPDEQMPEGLPLTGMTERFDVRCGIYRYKQPVGLHLVYDNIRYGTTFDDVIPTCKYNSVDINSDCVMDLLDVAIVAKHWLMCTDPQDFGCTETLRSILQ